MTITYDCLYCNKSHSSLETWIKHARITVRKSRSRECILCSKQFQTLAKHSKHLLRRECISEYPKDKCSYCHKLFSTKSSRIKHENNCCFPTLFKFTNDGSSVFTQSQTTELDLITIQIE